MESLPPCVCCHKTPEDYAQNLQDFQTQRDRFYTPELIERFVASNRPYEYCYACGEGQKTLQQSMEEMEALRETKIQVPVSRTRMAGGQFTIIPPNARCPCGSGKKYKKCCSTASAHAPRTSTRVKRNDPCPCGSGTKYKKCCLLKR